MANRKETRMNLNEFWSDRYGAQMDSAQGICNCLNKDCQGCFYPCPHCNSTKCMYLEIRRNIDSLKEKTSKDTNIFSSEAKQKTKKEGKNKTTCTRK